MSEEQFNPTAALLAAALNPKTTKQAYGIYKDLNHELQENRKRTTVQKEIEAAKKAGKWQPKKGKKRVSKEDHPSLNW